MYSSWISRMAAAGTPAARRAVVEDMCRVFAFSTAKAYRILHGAGWESCRAERHDAGKTAADERLVQAVGEMINICIRENGKATLPVNVARSILEARGVDVTVGDRRLRELLREKHISIQDAQTATPHQAMRSEYPNQVHLPTRRYHCYITLRAANKKLSATTNCIKTKTILKEKINAGGMY